jgi:EmrB/QacA subfamily drug resistance transporter
VWWPLIAVSLAVFMLLLDITVVNVALPSIQRSLNSSFQDLQWVVNAYALSLAAFLLTAGSLADLLGRRRVFTTGLVVFTAASTVCGVSSGSLMLNLARGAQGAGGAMMYATSLALIAEAFQGKERAVAFGVFGAVSGAAVAVGPLVGGAITSSIGWEWIFFVNVPIGILAVFITVTQVAESLDPGATRVDWGGLVTFSGSLFLLVLALMQGNDKGWSSTEIVGLLIGAAVLIAAFVIVESVQERPMLDLSLFRRLPFAGVSIVAFAMSASIFAIFLYLTLYLQDVLGYGPLQAGLRLLPLMLTELVVSPISGRLTSKLWARGMLGGGLVLVSAGLLLMSTIDAASGWTKLIAGFMMAGAGIGLINPPLASTAIGVVPVARSGMASGINNTFRQVGIATGTAGLGAVFAHVLGRRTLSALEQTAHAHQVLSAAHGQFIAALASGEVNAIARSLSTAAHAALTHAYRIGYDVAMTEILIIAGAVAMIGAVLGFALVGSGDRIASDPPASAPKPEPTRGGAA